MDNNSKVDRCDDKRVKSNNKQLAYFQKYGFTPGKTDKKGLQKLKFRLKQIMIERKSIKYNYHILKGKLSVLKNPKVPKITANDLFINEFESYARKLGIADIGYTHISPSLLFKNKTALFPNVIVLTLEMDKEKMNKAPSKETFEMIHDTYSRLNVITMKLADFLRKNGYGAQPTPATLGMCHYPPLAESAGLGCRGWHGLLITPKFGPRQRLSAIFTSIENLPFYTGNEHMWIRYFCKKCQKCVRGCPASALPTEETLDENGFIKHVDPIKCVAYFTENYGCSKCIKDCAFNNTPYEKIKSAFLK